MLFTTKHQIATMSQNENKYIADNNDNNASHRFIIYAHMQAMFLSVVSWLQKKMVESLRLTETEPVKWIPPADIEAVRSTPANVTLRSEPRRARFCINISCDSSRAT